MKDNRARKVEKAMKLVWGSLESHLDGAYLPTPEGKAFHKQCVREYAELMTLLVALY